MMQLNVYNYVDSLWHLIDLDELDYEELGAYLPQKTSIQNRYRQYILLDKSMNSTKKAFLLMLSGISEGKH